MIVVTKILIFQISQTGVIFSQPDDN